jgi:hypothetical protein
LWTTICLISSSGLSLARYQPVSFQPLFTESLHGDQLLVSPHFSDALRAHPPLLCVSFQFLFYCSVFFVFFFFFCRARGPSAQGAMLIYSRVTGGILHDAWSSPVDLLNFSQTGLEPATGGTEAPLFYLCNMAWRSFPWARGSGCQSFDVFWCFISAKCGSSISAMFLIYRPHAVCFCSLVTILDPPSCPYH